MTFAATARKILRWLAPRRRFPPTREGWWFLIATLLLGLAAINAGLNLLFLVWGMMLFLVLASGVLSELCLRHLAVSRKVPSAIHAGSPYLMGISLSNRKRRLPSFSVEVEDLVAGKPLDKRCYFLKLPAGRTQETAYRHQLSRRGRHQLTGFRLSTKFPFGLIQKSRDVADARELLIYPALVRVPEAMLRGFPATYGLGRHKWRSRSGEFAGLRDFRPGDDPRDIHWRSTARRGVTLVRESEDDEGLEATILFDNLLGDGRRHGGVRGGGVAGGLGGDGADPARLPGGVRRARHRDPARRRAGAAQPHPRIPGARANRPSRARRSRAAAAGARASRSAPACRR